MVQREKTNFARTIQINNNSVELLLHYAWKHRLLPLHELRTTDGEAVEVLDPGLHNHDAGPDFFNAKVRIGGTSWVGNVELHEVSTDWYRHGHHTDPAYDSVILHVATQVDTDVVTSNGRRLPQLQLEVPEQVRQHYERLCQTDDYPRCWPVVPQLSALTVHAWMSALVCERLNERASHCLEVLKSTDGDWQRTLFIILARNFGFGLNGDAFEAWARHLPLHAAAKHRDDLLQVEALFLGTAGLLEPEAVPAPTSEAAQADPYYQHLRREWEFLHHKFQLPPPLPYSRWRYLRLRPQNFPHLRLAQLARLFHEGRGGFDTLLAATTRQQLHEAFDTAPSEYWQTHYLFGATTTPNRKRLSTASRDLLIINTAVPMLYAVGLQRDDEALMQRAVDLLEALPPERNFITRQWQQCGLTADNAADSQALIQLKRLYCDRNDCLRCRFAYEYLKSEK